MEIKENKVKKWFGTYNGVRFEINNWINEYDNKEVWTYYIIIHLDRIPNKHKPKTFWLKGIKDGKHVFYRYYNHHVLVDLDWHGGLTYYNKENGFDGSEKIIKVGCDYNHIWNEERYYDLKTVKGEVKETIDKFLTHIPDYKYWCRGNGKLYSKKDGLIIKRQFNSKEYFGKHDWFKKAWAEKN